MFNLARALKAFEIRIDRRLPESEYAVLLSLWWPLALLEGMPSTKRFSEYLDLLILGYATAKTPLGEHVLENAVEGVPELPTNPTYEQQVERLLRVCRNLSKLSADGVFFIGRRDAGEIMGNTNPHFATNVIKVLLIKGVLIEVEKSTRTRATRYRFA
jgi:hypothetical protein